MCGLVLAAPAALACGETEIAVPRIDLDSDCSAATVNWTLVKVTSNSTEIVLFEHSGLPTEEMPLGAHVLGGSFGEPLINVANYHGPTLLQVITATQTAALQLFQTGIATVFDEIYRWRVSLAASQNFNVRLSLFKHDSSGSPNYGLVSTCLGNLTPLDVCEAHQTLTTDVASFAATATATDGRFRILFSPNNTYWIDNVALVRTSTGDNKITNGSFGSDFDDWSSACSGCTVTVIPIPEVLEEYGEYKLRLTVTHEGAESAPIEHTFQHDQCTGT